MRRILLLITDLEIGGTPTVVRELAVRLNQLEGVVVEVACLSKWGPVADELRGAGVTVHALSATSVRDVGVILRFLSLARRRGYDTVFSFLIHANTVAAIGRALLRYRLIESIQTTQPRPRWHWWLQRVVFPAADCLVVPSPSAAIVARERSEVPPERVVVIPNAVDPDAFSPSEIPIRGERPYPIGFIGRLDPVKRVPHLLRSLIDVRSAVHLHIFGEGPERADIVAAMESYGLRRRVTMHGAIARPQEALSRIGLLVLPSLAEGFGLVLIEAMAAGVPVVATNVPGIRDIIVNGKTGLLVPVHDPVALAGAIDRVIRDLELRNHLIANGLEVVRRRYTWANVIERYRRVLGLE